MTNEICIVCHNTITDDSNVKLSCEHKYCVNCFAKHMRLDNRCAMCRTEICEPIKKINKDENLLQLCIIISNIIENSYSETAETNNMDVTLSNFGLEIADKIWDYYQNIR